MEIGKKVLGFKFKSKKHGIYYNFAMDSKIGKIGEVQSIINDYCLVKFNDFESWYYPTKELKKNTLNKEIESYNTLINIIKRQICYLREDLVSSSVYNSQILYREKVLCHFKEQQFKVMLELYGKSEDDYKNTCLSVMSLFKDKEYKDTLKYLKRITKDLRKGLKNNML